MNLKKLHFLNYRFFEPRSSQKALFSLAFEYASCKERDFLYISFLLFFPFSKTSLLTPSVSVSIAFVTKSLGILLGIFVLRTKRYEGKQSEKANVTLVILAFGITISISADVLCIIQKHASRKP